MKETETRRDIGDGPERKCPSCDWLPESEEFFYLDKERPGRHFRAVCKVCDRERKLKIYHDRMAAKGVEVKPKEPRTKWPEKPLLADLW